MKTVMRLALLHVITDGDQRGGQRYFEHDNPLSSHVLAAVSDGKRTTNEPHPKRAGNPNTSNPPET
jgi:hypothetical protein